MQQKHLAAGLAPAMASARTLRHRSVDCHYLTPVDSGTTCASLADSWAMPVNDLIKLNPGIICPALDVSKEYCVMGEVTDDVPVTTSTTSSQSPITSTQSSATSTQSPITSTQSSTTSTKSSTTNPTTTLATNGVTTPIPTQTGMVGNCNKFILPNRARRATRLRLSIPSRRPRSCQYACVGVIGGTPPPTTTRAGNGITTPTPAHPGMISNCNKFAYVNPGDTCDNVAFWNGIGGQWVKLWHGIEEACLSIQAKTYVCVGVISGNGIATPTPAHPGMVNNCKKFAYVNPGDTCDGIGFWNGIGGQWVKLWNRIEEACLSIRAKTYVCVGVI